MVAVSYKIVDIWRCMAHRAQIASSRPRVSPKVAKRIARLRLEPMMEARKSD